MAVILGLLMLRIRMFKLTYTFEGSVHSEWQEEGGGWGLIYFSNKICSPGHNFFQKTFTAPSINFSFFLKACFCGSISGWYSQ